MYSVVLCTTSIAESQGIAEALIEERLAACVNIISGVASYFRWEGRLEHDEEALLIIKTGTKEISRIVERIKQLHSYEVPEIIALPIIGGDDKYLDWVRASIR